MSWVKQQKLPTVEAIHFQGQPCNDLSNLWRPLHQSYNAAANCSVDLSVLDEVPNQATHFWALFSYTGVMFIPLIVKMWWPTLKHLLIRHFAFVPFWKFQTSIQTIAMSDFGDTLIILDYETKTKSLKIWLLWITLFMMLGIIERLLSSTKYGIPKNFR